MKFKTTKKSSLINFRVKIPKLIMRTFIFLYCAIAFSLEVGFSQNANIIIDTDETISVKKIFRLINKQTDYKFIYRYDLIRNIPKIALEKGVIKTNLLLDRCLSSTSFTYEFTKNNTIIVKRKPVKQASNDIIQHEVSGTVTDKSGQPLPGVDVIVKGTNKGTSSDFDGKFSIDAKKGDQLQFSSMGYSDKIITVSKFQINIVLELDTKTLEEIVVVGYGTQKKVNLTGAITSIKTEKIRNMPVSNLSNALAGRAPGVMIVGNSGLAGATSSIKIRGSFGDPLYVINGVLKEKADFDALNPEEVKSINFLKDAASSAVYGSSAGNGVVIITTRQGSVQEPKFNYRGSLSTSRTTQEQQKYTAIEELNYSNNIAVTKGEPKPYGEKEFEYFKDKNYNINDLIWKNPFIQKHDLSVSGGTDKITYFLSLGYHKEQGSYHNIGYNKYNFRSDITAKLTKAFKVRVNISGNQRNHSRWYWPYDGSESAVVSDWYRVTFNWTHLYPFYVDARGNPTSNPNDFPVQPASSGFHPPEVLLNGGYRHFKKRTLDGIIHFNLDQYIKGLSTSLQGHISAYDNNSKSFVLHNKWYVFKSKDPTNKFIPGVIDPTQTKSHNLSAKYERINENVTLNSSYQLDWYLNYNRNFGNHAINALVVYEQQEYNGKNLSGRAENLLSSSIDQIYNASSDTEKRYFWGNEGQSARVSWIGRANYSFASKYIVGFSFRYDGNYKFAPENRWGFFPSISIAWRILEEDFMSKITWLSNLKIRGSYGTTGSDSGIDPWRWASINKKAKNGYIFGESLIDGLKPGAIPNTSITWSTIRDWNAGLDWGVLDGKLQGELDIWAKTESDILGSRKGSTPTTLGAELPAVNYAKKSWKGFEASASWNSKIGNIKYGVSVNMGYAIDQWDIYDEPGSHTDGTYHNNWRSQIGKPKDRVYGLISKGIIRTQEQLNALPKEYLVFGRVPTIGTLLFEDIRGKNYAEGPDGKIDENDKTYLSDNGKPRINYGIGLNLEWKGLSVNANFQGVGNYDRMISTRNGSGVFQIGRPYFSIWSKDYWTPENPNATYPRVAGNWKQVEYGGDASTFWVRNGAYLRLKNLNIGYSLSEKWFTKMGVEGVRIFINGTNLFVITGFKEHDPEQDTLDSYPLMKTYTGGLSINF